MRKHFTFANVMSAAAVFIALGGTAVALKANSVGGKQIKNSAVKSSDVADGKLRGKDLKEGSITSREIEEASFEVGQLVRFATAGGPSCDPDSLTFIECSALEITLSEQSQLLLVGSGEQWAAGGAPVGGSCRLSVDSVAVGPSTTTGGGSEHTPSKPNGFGLNTVHPSSGLLAKGDHDIAIECNEADADVVFDTTLSVLAIGGVDG